MSARPGRCLGNRSGSTFCDAAATGTAFSMTEWTTTESRRCGFSGELDEMIELQRELDAAKEETAIVAESAEVTAPSRAELPEASPGPDGGDDGQNMPSFATSTASASPPANPARNLQQLAPASAEPERNLSAAPGAAASTPWLAEDSRLRYRSTSSSRARRLRTAVS
jgi:hypothetical protein